MPRAHSPPTQKLSHLISTKTYLINSLNNSQQQASRLDNDSLHEGNSNSQLGHLAEDYSNDSFGERERDSFSGGFSAAGKLPKGGSQLNECLEYLHRMVHRKDKEGRRGAVKKRLTIKKKSTVFWLNKRYIWVSCDGSDSAWLQYDH